MIGLCVLILTLAGISGAEREYLLKLQFPLYGLSELAAREYAKDKSSCNNQMKSVFYGIQKRERWALKMLGASGAPISGFVWGSNYWTGSYSRCQWIFTTKRVPQAPLQTLDEVQPFKVTFYVASFKEKTSEKSERPESPDNLIHFGLCLPSVCTSPELEPLLKQWTNLNPLTSQNVYNFTLELQRVEALQRNFSWIFSPVTFGLGAVVVIVILLTLSGTLYDVYVWTPIQRKKALDSLTKNNNESVNFNNRNIRESSKLLNRDNNLNECCELKINNSQFKSMPIHIVRPETEMNQQEPQQNIFGKLTLCFSVKSNVKQIFSKYKADKGLSVAHGLRFFGIAWLIWLQLAHYNESYKGSQRLLFAISKLNLDNMATNSTFVFDTFFFTSGFLLAYKYYKNRKGSIKVDPNFSIKMKVNELSLAVVRRFLRFTPYYFIAMGIAIVIMKISKQIGLIELHEQGDEICQKSWWRNLAYVNNLFRRDEMCLPWTWYIATDMQYFFIGLIILILSTRFLKITTISSIIVVISSSLLTGYYASQYFSIISSFHSESTLLDLLYTSPWTRIGPYLIGMFTGYFTVHLKGELVLKKAILITCWMVGIVCFVWSLSGLNNEGSHISATLHTVLSRIAWSFSLSWVTIAFCTNNADIMKPILSLPIWIPLNKLFFSAYMLSPSVFTTMVSNAEMFIEMDSFQMVVYFLGSLIIIYIFAFIFSLLVEIPLANLGKTLVGQRHIQNQLT